MKFEPEQPTIAVLALRAFAEGPFVPRSIFALLGDLEVAVKLMHRWPSSCLLSSWRTGRWVHVRPPSPMARTWQQVPDHLDQKPGPHNSAPRAGCRRKPAMTIDPGGGGGAGAEFDSPASPQLDRV